MLCLHIHVRKAQNQGPTQTGWRSLTGSRWHRLRLGGQRGQLGRRGIHSAFGQQHQLLVQRRVVPRALSVLGTREV